MRTPSRRLILLFFVILLASWAGVWAETFNITYYLHPQAGGLVTMFPVGPYTAGQNVTVMAVPNPEYKFIGWSGGLTDTTSSVTFTITGNMVITANFAIDQPADMGDMVWENKTNDYCNELLPGD